MTYTCRHKTNPIFPYPNKFHKLKKGQPSKSTASKTYKDDFFYNQKVDSHFSDIFDKLLSPVEKILGRKIHFDDIILIALIYLLYTEKDDENTTLLLCLIFVLLG